jgi:hypothetical protein
MVYHKSVCSAAHSLQTAFLAWNWRERKKVTVTLFLPFLYSLHPVLRVFPHIPQNEECGKTECGNNNGNYNIKHSHPPIIQLLINSPV